MGQKIGEAKTNEWMHALEIKQPNSAKFERLDKDGCWMPLQIQRFVLQDVKK